MGTAILNQKTVWPTVKDLPRRWYLADAKDQVLGRLATRIASLLFGKGKPFFTPSVDCGDFVIVVNVDKMKFTGNKLEDKHIFHHTFHPGGARVETYKKLNTEKPERILFYAVKRMLPKNKHAARQIIRMKT